MNYVVVTNIHIFVCVMHDHTGVAIIMLQLITQHLMTFPLQFKFLFMHQSIDHKIYTADKQYLASMHFHIYKFNQMKQFAACFDNSRFIIPLFNLSM